MLTHAATSALCIVPHRTDVWRASRKAESGTGLFAHGCWERTAAPKQEIFGEGEPAENIYMMIEGVVRSYKSLVDGRRKIDAFRLRGDVFGLEAGTKHEYCAESVDAVRMLVTHRNVGLRQSNESDGGRDLWHATVLELQRVQRHTLLLAKNAQQRVACFLLEMSRRLGQPDVVELAMPRQDIADYLGLTVETVSRTITQMEAKGLIALPTARQIVLRDVAALRRIDSGSFDKVAGVSE
jgi:CRP-like cAMP-binding protein